MAGTEVLTFQAWIERCVDVSRHAPLLRLVVEFGIPSLSVSKSFIGSFQETSQYGTNVKSPAY